MAITQIQSPALHSPAYNYLWFMASSTNKTQPNFKYVFDIYNSTEDVRLARVKVPIRPDSVNGYGLLDVQRIIENYLSFDFNITDVSFQKNPNSFKSYVIKYGEEYGATPVLYPDLNSSQVKYAWNSIFDFIDFNNFNESDFVVPSSAKRFLTNSANAKIKFNQNAFLYLINPGESDPPFAVTDYMEIKTYNSSGALIDTFRIDNPYKFLVDEDERFLRFSSGTYNLNQIDGADFTLGSQPIITASVASYTLRTFNESGVFSSELFTYIIDDSCSKYSNVRLHFLNKLGGFDSFNFDLLNRENIDVTRSNYQKSLGRFLAPNGYGYDKSDRGTVQFDTKAQQKFTINSNWITDAEAIWLEELITSPEVFQEVEGSTRYLIPVNINTNSYEKKKKVNDKVFNITLEFQYAFNKERQRG